MTTTEFTFTARTLPGFITAFGVKVDGKGIGRVGSKALGTGSLTRSNTWTAIRPDGSTVGGFASRNDAAEALR